MAKLSSMFQHSKNNGVIVMEANKSFKIPAQFKYLERVVTNKNYIY
jgi:hypothetical protein